MAYFLLGILSVASVLFVAYPLYSPKKYLLYIEDIFDIGECKRLSYLHSKKESIYANIKDLEFEYQMGKLSEEDFIALREGYMAEAAAVLRSIEELKIKTEIEELIESEVRSRRKIKPDS